MDCHSAVRLEVRSQIDREDFGFAAGLPKETRST